MSSPRLVTLLTDFGLRDPFVGVMRGVIASIAPHLTVVDLTHGIPPQAIAQGAFWLTRSFPYFPPGTVHVAVVDPGVGTTRRPLVVRAAGHLFVGPDNGLLTPLLTRDPDASARIIDPQHGLSSLSSTFHGRDLFSPVAARLAAGLLTFEQVGPLTDCLQPPPWPAPTRHDDHLAGHVVVIDHFGNLLTDLATDQPRGEVLLRDLVLPLRTTYGDTAPGEVVALLNSWGDVEIAVRNGHAASSLRVEPGEPVRLLPSRRSS